MAANDQNDTARPASECASLAELRGQIDRIDAALIERLAERQSYLDVIARLKGDASKIRDPARIEEMIARLRASALQAGLDPLLAEQIWRAIAEASAQYQERVLGAPSPDAAKPS